MKTRVAAVLPLVSWILLVSLASPNQLRAQVDRGGIVGTITDPTSARIPGAEITITNTSTNEAKRLTSDTSGNYAANLLRIGTYSVTVQKQGFEKLVKPTVEVGVNQVIRIDCNCSWDVRQRWWR